MFKKRTFQLSAMISGLILAVVLIGLTPVTTTHAAPIRIMALGDSITGSPGCWRAILWNQLRSAGYTDFEPVGTLPPQGCPQGDDGYNEGHGGYLATNIANQDQLPPWLDATNPDIVLMHLGTNDLFSGTNTTGMVLAAYTKMVGQMRANNPNMKILVAKIIPMYTATTGCTECYQRVIDLNAAIPNWAAGLSTTQSPIIVVDLWTGFDTTIDTSEGVHPNDAGFQKMADKWYPPLASVLGGIVPTNAPTAIPSNTSVAPTATPTSGGGATCSPVDATISAPFSHNGVGSFCWQSNNLGAYVNSWNLAGLTINGVDFTNTYVSSGSYPAQINGYWYVSYVSNVAWGHFEAAGTGGPTNTPAAATNTPFVSTPTLTHTPVVATNTPVAVTATPILTNTPVAPTATPTSGGGGCSPVDALITAPFTQNGAGTFCWQASSLGSYLNSWNLASLTINGVDYTNTYVSVSSLPAKIDGYWYIAYTGNYPWSHFEAK